jgi:hypothetical protein
MSQNDPPLHARNRRAWQYLFVFLLCVIVFETWSHWPSESAVSRARQVQLGDTKARVAEIMGPPRMVYQKGITDRTFYGSKPRWQLEAQAFLSRKVSSWLFAEEPFEVEIDYSTDGRVQIIRTVPAGG